MKSIVIKAADGKDLQLYTQLSGNVPKANVLIIHGMAEHAARYEDFAMFLNSKGFDVYAPDLRGHGKTAGKIDNTGHLADHNGWEIVIEDIQTIVSTILKTDKNVPLILIGHSMGSLIARSYFEKHSNEIHALILSGTSYQPKMLVYGGLLMCRLQQLFFGIKHRSKLLTKMSFGNFNKKFKNTTTDFDWLSSDPTVPAKYIDDEYCGFICTVGFFRDLLTGILCIQSKKHFKNFPKDKLVYMFSGALDSVGNSGKGVRKVFERYRQSGVSNIQLKLYPEGRHEMLNEIDKVEVFEDVKNYIEKALL
jgi:alpha-beta hydrolase superfamily lysophospholipase